MSWGNVGGWIKENAGTGASLVGSLLTGNLPAAVAAGVSLVSGATGSDNPDIALAQLKSDPKTMVKLKSLYYENEASVRSHIENIKRLELEDAQASHSETQNTIRNGDNSHDKLVRRTRPLQSWVSLMAAIMYVFLSMFMDGVEINFTVLGLLLALPWSYAGLRQIGKGINSFKGSK